MSNTREATAWRIVWAAFVVFIVLCGGLVYVFQWFIWRSTVSMGLDVAAARGTVRVILPTTEEAIGEVARREIEEGSVLLTDVTSQATVNVVDTFTNESVVSVVLFRDTEVEVTRAVAPRFPPNSLPHLVEIEHRAGRSEILIMGAERGDGVEVHLDTPHGEIVLLDEGQYLVDTTAQATRITARTGEAWVLTPETERGLILKSNQRTVIRDSDDPPETLDAEYSLLLNSSFAATEQQEWAFYAEQDMMPESTIAFVNFQGRDAVQISRSEREAGVTIRSHGEAGLMQRLNLDVSEFSYLELRTTFFIEEQSLSLCGEAGSECPMMLRMTYIAADGSRQELITGFYAHVTPETSWPPACATCRTEHQQLNMGSWYTYESGNLVTGLPENLRPVIIEEVRFYASGWAYRTYVSEVDLLAGD